MLIGFEKVKLKVKEIKISGKPVFIKVSDLRNFGEYSVIGVIIMRDIKVIVSWLEIVLRNLVVKCSDHGVWRRGANVKISVFIEDSGEERCRRVKCVL